ncbi:uncharacterized protein [Ptychodera flava]|uniref:uncharacterized protein n=1 Tax=Ptychodera flava TaxID=63121 RepID=UPI00396A9EE5
MCVNVTFKCTGDQTLLKMASQSDVTIAEKFLKPLTGLRNLYELLEEDLPKLSVSLKGTLTPFIDIIEETSFGLFVEHMDGLTAQEREDVLELLQHTSDHIKAISRLLYSIGTNNTKVVTFALTDVTEQLEKKIRSFEDVRKRLSRAFSRPSSSAATLDVIRNETGRLLWERCFGSRSQIPLIDFHRKISMIIDNRLQCPVEDLQLFFNGEFLTLESYNRFLNILSANMVTTAKGGFVGPAKSLSDFIRLQLRLGHLREPVLRARARSSSQLSSSSDIASATRSDSAAATMDRRDLKLFKDEQHTDMTWIKPHVVDWFREVDEICRFFYGTISPRETVGILEGRDPGSFLLRFSSDNPDSLCVSAVHSVPKKDRGGWKELVMRVNVIVHHELVMTGTRKKTHDIDITRRKEGEFRRCAVTRQQAYDELKRVLDFCEEVDVDLSWL